jgi:catechol 2,3-dioxygenase-like lactoylglutathione lyase family enzyme
LDRADKSGAVRDDRAFLFLAIRSNLLAGFGLQGSRAEDEPMIDHVSLGTNDIARAKAFYDPVLAVLDIKLQAQEERELLYGAGQFIISIVVPLDGKPATPGNGTHIAFAAKDRAMVDRFYQVAMANGGTEDGAPGLRPDYDAHYYGAFVRDPDGNKIEALTLLSR